MGKIITLAIVLVPTQGTYRGTTWVHPTREQVVTKAVEEAILEEVTHGGEEQEIIKTEAQGPSMPETGGHHGGAVEGEGEAGAMVVKTEGPSMQLPMKKTVNSLE